MATVGKVVAVLTATTKPFERGLRRAGKVTRRFSSSVAAMGKRMIKFGTVAVAVVAAGLALVVRRQLKLIDSLGKLSRNIDVSVASLQALHLAAGIAGIETDKFDKALKRMIKSVADAQNGLSLQIRAFEALGIGIESLKGKKPDEIFRIIADAVQKTGASTERTAAIMDLFGTRVGADLVNLLAQGSENLDEMRRLMDDLGLSMTNVDVAKIEQANDAWLTFKTVLDGIAKKLTVEIAPFITLFSNKLIEAGREGEKMGGVIHSALIGVIKVVGFFRERLNDIVFGWLSIKLAALKTMGVLLRAMALVGIAVQDNLTELAKKIAETQAAIDKNLSAPGTARLVNQFKRVQEEAARAAEKTLEIGKAVQVTSEEIEEAAKRMAALKRAAETAAMRLKSLAKRVFEATRTPLEKFVEKIRELRVLLREKLIDEDTFARAVKKARSALKGVAAAPAKRLGEARQVVLSKLAIGGVSRTGAKSEERLSTLRNVVLDKILTQLETNETAPTVIAWND